MTGPQFRDAIVHLHCMERKDFLRVFGSTAGARHWMKWNDESLRRAGEFLCDLDVDALEKLWSHLSGHVGANA